MAHFKKLTTSSPDAVNAVVMGRKTWESIPEKFRPLPNRTNVVLTRNPASVPNKKNVLVVATLDEAREKLKDISGRIFVIGGEDIYRQCIEQGWVTKVYYTEVSGLDEETTKFDTYFPNVLESPAWTCHVYNNNNNKQEETNKENNEPSEEAIHHVDPASGLKYRFLEYRRKVAANNQETITTTTTAPPAAVIEEGAHLNPEEVQYLDLCRDIIEHGVKRGDRTGTGTLSKFGTQMRFSLRDGTIPLLTTKRTFWRGIAEELLWFISGNTNSNELAKKDVHIWDGNGSREFLDQRGLSHREEGDLGPVYGFQWRHFGAKYVDMHTDYTGQGVDQLADCIRKIKECPEDRRIILSAWNPADLNLMALPPCHMFCQFYVDTEKNELSCQMYQRSADMGLGVPFNIASYALLTYLVAHVTGRQPGDFVHTIGDAHVYLNHVDALKEQLTRQPRAFPKLNIKREVTDIDDFVYDDLELLGYKPHKSISMKMAL